MSPFFQNPSSTSSSPSSSPSSSSSPSDGCENSTHHQLHHHLHHHHHYPHHPHHPHHQLTTILASTPPPPLPPGDNDTYSSSSSSTTVLPSDWTSALPLWNGSSPLLETVNSTNSTSDENHYHQNLFCPPAWDGFYCWPATPAGHQAVRSCEHIFSEGHSSSVVDLPQPIATIMHQQNVFRLLQRQQQKVTTTISRRTVVEPEVMAV
ncbi:hypothetical protein TYRP_020208 [Tyrophagus putrescentiae]|nr:hypothetical protein TYRP_020208 [Tyrophagus putrescentiae]